MISSLEELRQHGSRDHSQGQGVLNASLGEGLRKDERSFGEEKPAG